MKTKLFSLALFVLFTAAAGFSPVQAQNEFTDQCLNIPDEQVEVPFGWYTVPEDTSGTCYVCANLDEGITSIPEGYEMNTDGYCVQIEYACQNHANIPGNPTGIPFGYYQYSIEDDQTYNCYVCESLDRGIEVVPAGYHVELQGESYVCVPDPTPTPDNPGGPGDGRSDGQSDGRSSCPDCTKAPSGQVLGASTDVLAATGDNSMFRVLMAGSMSAFVLLSLVLARRSQ